MLCLACRLMPIKKYPSKTHLARVWVKLQTFHFRNLHCKQNLICFQGQDISKITVPTTQVKPKGLIKVEKILKDYLNSIPSPLLKIQIMGQLVCLRCKGKTLLGIVNKLLKIKSWLTMLSNVLPLHFK